MLKKKRSPKAGDLFPVLGFRCRLLHQHLFQLGEAGEGILLRQLRLALNEWQGIVDEVVTSLVPPSALIHSCGTFFSAFATSVSGSSFVLQA